jgi:hypothetical protein
MTRKLSLMLIVLAGLSTVGCKSFDTPRSLRGSERPDRPDLPIEEQQSRGRARYGLHEDDFRVGPNTFTDRVSPTGVGR